MFSNEIQNEVIEVGLRRVSVHPHCGFCRRSIHGCFETDQGNLGYLRQGGQCVVLQVAVDLRDKMADRGVLSYEEFLASVFDSMGIPIGNVELISAERTSLSHSDVDGLTSVREITPPVIKLEVETQSSLKECSRDSTPDAVPGPILLHSFRLEAVCL